MTTNVMTETLVGKLHQAGMDDSQVSEVCEMCMEWVRQSQLAEIEHQAQRDRAVEYWELYQQYVGG